MRTPHIKKVKCTIVTDNQRAIVNITHNVLTNIPHVRCWNHTFRDVRGWLHNKHVAPSTDIATYIGDVWSLLHWPSLAIYSSQLSVKWDAQFEQYYTKEIHSRQHWKVALRRARYPYSGVTTNQSKSMNRVTKNLQGWKEAQLDGIVLALHQLQAYYRNKIKWCFTDIGECHIAQAYAFLKVNDPLQVDYIPICSLEGKGWYQMYSKFSYNQQCKCRCNLWHESMLTWIRL